jgi:hypothetical protein
MLPLLGPLDRPRLADNGIKLIRSLYGRYVPVDKHPDTFRR